MDDVTPTLLARFLAGDLDGDEDDRVRSWLDAHPDVRAALMDVERPGTRLTARKNLDHFLGGLLKETESSSSGRHRDAGSAGREDEREVGQRRRGSRPDRRGRRPPAGPRRIRADRSSTASSNLGSRRFDRSSTRTTQIALAALALLVMVLVGRDTLLKDAEPVVYSTEPGQYTDFTLPDGSEVKLNVASRLIVPEEFGAGSRHVRLEGEAFFDVKFDPRQPFVVQTAALEVFVRGTEFNVSAYAADPASAVVVTEGSVAVTSGTEEVVLAPGDRATARDGVLEVDQVEPQSVLSWTDGRLEFRAARMDEVARRMQRWFGVPVRLGTEGIDSMQVNAVIEGDSAKEAADAVAAALGLSVATDGDTLVFRRAVP